MNSEKKGERRQLIGKIDGKTGNLLLTRGGRRRGGGGFSAGRMVQVRVGKKKRKESHLI